MRILKELIRIIAAIAIGYPIVNYFNIEKNILRMVFYFGIYIVVSLIIEMIWNSVVKKKKNEDY